MANLRDDGFVLGPRVYAEANGLTWLGRLALEAASRLGGVWAVSSPRQT